MKPWENGTLKVSENKRYLCNGDKPFFWMGDTAWLLFQQCSLEESYMYLKNRADKGFTVIQAVLLHAVKGAMDSSLADVEKDVTKKEFWEHCDQVVKMAEDLGGQQGFRSHKRLFKAQVLHPDRIPLSLGRRPARRTSAPLHGA